MLPLNEETTGFLNFYCSSLQTMQMDLHVTMDIGMIKNITR